MKLVRQRISANGPRRMNRRELLRMTGALGLATVGATAVGLAAAAAPSGRGGRGLTARLQEGTPAAVATPQLGVQADGTRLWRVKVGGMDMEAKIDAQAFYPGEITINAGDAIWFEFPMMPGFHTVTFPISAEPLPLLIPADGAATATAGPPQLEINPAILFPTPTAVVDGTQFVNSGADILMEPGSAFIATFPTPGTYDYLCVSHGAVMTAKLTVQEAGAALPHEQADYDAMAAEEYAALLAEGKAEAEKYAQAIATTRDDGTTLWELSAGAGPGKARVMAILPESHTIKVGDTVRWVNRSPGEPHTVTFVSGEAPPEDTLVEPQPAGPPKFLLNNLTLLPQGGTVYSGTGYFNSGFLGEAFIGVDRYELTFDTPGEYPYYCILHGGADGTGMAAKLTVEAR